MDENEVRGCKNLEIEVDETMGHGKLIDQILDRNVNTIIFNQLLLLTIQSQ